MLASETQVNRQCVITGLTNDIFSKTNAEIISDININSHINVVLFSKHESPHNNIKYFFITLDSKIQKDQTIEKGTVDIFQSNFTVLETHRSKKTTYNRPRSPPLTFGSQRTQQQGPIYNRGGQSYSHNLSVPVDTSNPPPNFWKPLALIRTQQIKSSATPIPNDIDFKLLVELTSKVCEVLSYGRENPEA